MAQDKKRKRKDYLFEYILFALLKEGSLTLSQLQEHVALQTRMPEVCSEFTVGSAFNFRDNFAEIVKLLLDRKHLHEKDGR